MSGDAAAPAEGVGMADAPSKTWTFSLYWWVVTVEKWDDPFKLSITFWQSR